MVSARIFAGCFRLASFEDRDEVITSHHRRLVGASEIRWMPSAVPVKRLQELPVARRPEADALQAEHGQQFAAFAELTVAAMAIRAEFAHAEIW